MKTKIRGNAIFSAVKHSVGHQGRLGSLVCRCQEMRKILKVGVIKAQGWQRPWRSCSSNTHLVLESPRHSPCQVVIVKLFYEFSEEGYRIFRGLSEKIHLRVGNPASVTCWSIWFLILSCNIFIFQFLVIYKFDMPAFYVSSVFLIKVSGPGIEPCDMT